MTTIEPGSARSRNRDGITRVTVDIPDEDVKRVAGIAGRHHLNRTSALVRAIRTAALVDEAAQRGSRVLIVDADGTQREIILA